MATATPASRLDRIKHVAEDANPAFAAGAVVVPIGIAALAALSGNHVFLFYTHVAAGAIWFALALFFPAVVGPTLGGLSPEVAAEFTGRFTPKVVFFMFGIPTATVLSGTALASAFGLLAAGDVWVNAALALGWGLWVFGLVVVSPTHLKIYWQTLAEAPDTVLLERLERRVMVVGLVDAVVMLVVIGLMTGIRLG